METERKPKRSSSRGGKKIRSTDAAVAATLTEKQSQSPASEAEAKYRELVERLPQVIYTAEMGIAGKWFYISPNVEDLLGFKPEEWLSDPGLWYRLVHPDDRKAQEAIEERSSVTGEPFENVYRMFTRDRRMIWVRDSGLILPSQKGDLPVVQGTLTDVTEQIQVAEALRVSEARYRLLFDNMTVGILLADTHGHILEVNPAALKILGSPSADATRAINLLSFQPLADSGISASYRQSFELGRPSEGEFIYTTKWGKNIDVLLRFIPIPNENGTIELVQILMEDISERKQSEEALRFAEEKYRSLVEQIPAVVYLDRADTSSSSFYISPQIENLLGCPPSAYIQDPTLWHKQVHPDDYERAAATVQETFEHGHAVDEYRLLTQDGRSVWVRDTSILIRDEAGQPKYIQGLLEDITERKLNEKLQASIYEIARASMTAQSLEELYAKIHSALQGLLPAPNFYIALYDRERDLLSFPYYIDAFDTPPQPQKPGHGLTEYVLRSCKPLLVTRDILAELTQQGEVDLVGTDSIEWLGVPLIVHEQAIGVMAVQTYDESVHFGLRDEEVMTYVSIQVASVIERKQGEEALRRSEAFTRSIVENEPECVKIIARDGALQYMNPAGLDMLEEEEIEHVLGRQMADFVAPKHRAAFQKLFERVMRGQPGTLQFEVIGSKGTRRWLDTHAVPLFDAHGKVESLLGITRDITQRRQADALQEAVYRIANTAETSPTLGDLFPQIHKIISSVMPAENFFITLYDEEKNTLTFPYFQDEQDEPFLEQLEPGVGLTTYVLRTGKSLLCTQEIRDELERQGMVKLLGARSRIWLGVPLLVEGRAIGVMVVQHYSDPEAYGQREQHILEFVSSQVAIAIRRKQAEDALRESEERYRSLVSGMLDGVYRSTHEGRFVDVNPAMLRLFGYDSREEMLQVDIKKDLYFAPGERESLFLDTGQEKVDVFRMKRKDGTEIWVEDHGRYVHDEHGNVIYHEGILRDVTERIQAEREINRLLQESQQRLRHVEALRSIDLAIGSSMDLRTTLNILLSYVKSLLAVDASAILLFNRTSQAFEFAAGNGFRSRLNETTFHPMGRGFASRVALERRILQFRDSSELAANRELSALWRAEGFVTYTGVPLIAKGELKGVLEIYHRSVFHPDSQWTDLLQNFSTQAAIAVENAQLFNELQHTNFELSLAYDATIEGWSRALELRENEPPGHSQRVTDLTLVLGRAMGIRDVDLIHIRRGALLHDIGKMGVPDSILHKSGPLTEEEWVIMRKHPIFAREMLTPISYLRPALDIPCFHHEKWDGSGYPNGLKGEEIPLAARIFAVADVFDSSLSERIYRKGISREKALELIKMESGRHFDPKVVGAFLQIVSKGQMSF